MRVCAFILAAVACEGDKDPTTTTAGDPCEGAGSPSLSLGTGGQLGFVPFVQGETIAVQTDPGGRYGLYIDLYTEGLDTTSSVTAFLRFSIGEQTETTDVGASLLLTCTDEGTGWFGSFAPLDDALQNPIDVVTIDGLDLHLSGNVTDASGKTGTVQVDLVLSTEEL